MPGWGSILNLFIITWKEPHFEAKWLFRRDIYRNSLTRLKRGHFPPLHPHLYLVFQDFGTGGELRNGTIIFSKSAILLWKGVILSFRRAGKWFSWRLLLEIMNRGSEIYWPVVNKKRLHPLTRTKRKHRLRKSGGRINQKIVGGVSRGGREFNGPSGYLGGTAGIANVRPERFEVSALQWVFENFSPRDFSELRFTKKLEEFLRFL